MSPDEILTPAEVAAELRCSKAHVIQGDQQARPERHPAARDPHGPQAAAAPPLLERQAGLKNVMPDDGTVMTYVEAARFLGISKRTLERYVRERRIPYVRLPKRGAWGGVRFLRPQLVHWLEQYIVKPAHSGAAGR